MRRRDFDQMIRRMARELPEPYLDGIEEIAVTGKAIPHPVRADVYTMGECVPHQFGVPGESDRALRSSVYLHYGSFVALARLDPDFDWRREAWETLTHEVRHHLEWRAREGALEQLDAAAEANYARHDGESFDPEFHLAGERVSEGVTKVEDDVFIDVVLGARAFKAAGGAARAFVWHGRRWEVKMPPSPPDVLFARITGVAPEPAGDLVLVIRRRPGARDLLRRPVVKQVELKARLLGPAGT